MEFSLGFYICTIYNCTEASGDGIPQENWITEAQTCVYTNSLKYDLCYAIGYCAQSIITYIENTVKKVNANSLKWWTKETYKKCGLLSIDSQHYNTDSINAT